jgi:predicted ribosomally synthesized peptide with nif11-like leader
MPQQNLIAFFEKANQDSTLLQQYRDAESPQEKLQVINAAGFAVTNDDINELAKDLVESSQQQDLSDQELEKVAGGFFISAVWPEKWGGSAIGQFGDDILGIVAGAVGVPGLKDLYGFLDKRI